MIDEDNIIIIIQHHGFLTLRPVDEKRGVHVVDVTIVEQEAASFKLRDFERGGFRAIYDFGAGPPEPVLYWLFAAWQSLQTSGMGTCDIVKNKRRAEEWKEVMQLALLSDLCLVQIE